MSQIVTSAINSREEAPSSVDESLIQQALNQYRHSFDARYGGFGNAPKFPAPHNLFFLMQQYQKSKDKQLLEMAEKTLMQMYRGGLFDHIGGGFCRYSTDRYYLVPHFEKMLCDNALLIIAYCEAFRLTQKVIYRTIAEKTADYILREMKSPQGGFYSAQDADTDGEEGKYYTFYPREIKSIIGEADGEAFCGCYDITESGNFNGKSIPNLLRTVKPTDRFDAFLPSLREYRKNRTRLLTDDKILTFRNSLMIAALCTLYRVTGNDSYLHAAKAAQAFIEDKLCADNTLYVSYRDEKHGVNGFLDDYAGYIYALIALYDTTLDNSYLNRARQMTDKALAEFFDTAQGGLFMYGSNNEELIARTKESYDGAVPCGNSLMTYNLVRLNHIAAQEDMQAIIDKQLRFMSGRASTYPSGFAAFLIALSDYTRPPLMLTIVRGDDDLTELPFHIPSGTAVRVFNTPDKGYELLNNSSAFYICNDKSCLPPINKTDFYKKYKSFV